MTAPTARPARHTFGERSHRAGIPEGIAVEERAPDGGWDAYGGSVVILVHGSLDRASSFARTALRLPDVAVVAYDRRGYQASRDAAPAAGLTTHIEDLRRIALAYGREPSRPVVAVGHSVGGTVVLGAAVATPPLFAAVGAYEPTMPWLGFHRPAETSEALSGEHPARHTTAVSTGATVSTDPGDEAEWFFKRMVGEETWDRLPDSQRASRRADGPALHVDLRSVRGAPPFDVTTLEVPTIVASGGPASYPHHRQTAEWLAGHVAFVRWTEIADAAHGAHLSHPDAFAALVRSVLAAGRHPTGCG